ITEAVAKATNDSMQASQARSIYAAPGTYDVALGEQFPIVLRGGLSLLGAGVDQTVVSGAGSLTHTGTDGVTAAHYYVTILVGDATLPTSISNVTIRSGTAGAAPLYTGVLCDRGDSAGGSTGQTSLDSVSLGPGYHACIMAMSSANPSPSGCNL